MAQFDVYQNPSRNTRTVFPYIVDVQNPIISNIATRIVVPLGKLKSFNNEIMKGLTPEVEYQGEKLLFLTPQISSIPANVLKKPIGSLGDFRHELISAIDFAITGI